MADLISKAKSGDNAAFQALTEPHRRELRVHCYRMLGSFQDAEDALQDTLMTAWRSFEGFEARASVRTWLYRIATNQCLNARRTEARRPAKDWNVPGVAPPPEPTSLGEVVWLEPFPDALLHEPLALLSPEASYERSETMSLAFITALQLLPPRQVAVLVLRDVLSFQATEVAEMLDATVESVNSALKRARATLEEKRRRDREPSPRATNEEEHAIAKRFITAYESADLEAVVALLTDNVFISMPPMPFEYEGKALVGKFCSRLFEAGRRFKLVPTMANGQPAFGTYLRSSSTGGPSEGVGLIALTLSNNQITAMTRFEHTVLQAFDLPPSLP